MKGNFIRMLIPANSGAILKRRWVDDRGHPVSYRFITWVGLGPFGAGALGVRGKNQV